MTVAASQLLGLTVRRLSHYLKSPLSVLYGVLDDHLKGQNLSEADYRDALDATERILSCLKLLERMEVISKEEVDLEQVKDELAAELPANFTLGVVQQSVIPTNLFGAISGAAVGYLTTRRGLGGHCISLDRDSLVIKPEGDGAFERASLMSQAEELHSMPSILLLYLQAVAEEYDLAGSVLTEGPVIVGFEFQKSGAAS